MQEETKQCQNCKSAFTVDAQDFEFYEKMHVPTPTWCVRCRLQRRLAFRNERNLYKRRCAVPGHSEELVSMYSSDKKATVFDHKFWWSDGWDALDYGRDYDFSRPFFEQFRELLVAVPVPSLYVMNAVNSDYGNYNTDNKNCYLVFGGDYNEDCAYSTFNFHSKDCLDLYFCDHCELCYECVDTNNCFRVLFSRYANDCNDSAFLFNCVGLSNCLGCVNLKKKAHCIFNEQYSKEEYEKKVKEFNLHTHEGLNRFREQFEKFRLEFPYKYA